jgi:hypothetical protein
VAREALKIIHFDVTKLPAAFGSADLAAVEELRDGKRICEAGCYQCLLSYFNQPDHEHINRRDPAAQTLLVQLAQSTVGPATKSAAAAADAGPLAAWLAALEKHGLRKPDSTATPIADGLGVADAVYKSARALVFLSAPAPELATYAADRGYSVLLFPASSEAWPECFAQHPEVFGAPTPA